jgi:hypothetical protein
MFRELEAALNKTSVSTYNAALCYNLQDHKHLNILHSIYKKTK